MQKETEEGRVTSGDCAASEKDQSSDNEPSTDSEKGEHPLKRLLIFQLKLALDALRDFALSPVALIATLADMMLHRSENNSYFAQLMRFGRETDFHINLFEHKRRKKRTFDKVVEQVEALLIKEYQDGELSAKAKAAIEKSLRPKKKQANETDA